MRIPKGSTVSKELSKHFGRVFNTKETFIFDIGKEDSNVNLYGTHVDEYLKHKHQVNVKGKNDGKKIERSKNFQVVSQSNKGTSGEE
ncbi:hypothetical protein [uncultured Mediterranean phage uvMED]|nr:hypothetical protein [uncultured Mediterranean phage uvMED]BAQ91480.1 hypothetical protein [uncultured Mediterranean phage uvMED]BAQ91513.1 hypothetical protein [uncultured Mediterranean phage uvMED]